MPEENAQTEPPLPVLGDIGGEDFKEDCYTLRKRIDVIAGLTLLVCNEHPVFTCAELDHPTVENQRGEMKANLKLAYRHLEDARMRVGKAIQTFDGGISCYPR